MKFKLLSLLIAFQVSNSFCSDASNKDVVMSDADVKYNFDHAEKTYKHLQRAKDQAAVLASPKYFYAFKAFDYLAINSTMQIERIKSMFYYAEILLNGIPGTDGESDLDNAVKYFEIVRQSKVEPFATLAAKYIGEINAIGFNLGQDDHSDYNVAIACANKIDKFNANAAAKSLEKIDGSLIQMGDAQMAFADKQSQKNLTNKQ